MFAFLISPAMDPFYKVVLSYPTILFSALLILCTLFCLVSLLGVFDFDIFNFDMPGVDGIETGVDVSGDELSNANVLASLLMRFGLIGIPAPIILFSMSLLGWMISFTLSYYLLSYIPGGVFTFIFGTIAFVITLYLSAWLTGFILRPFKSFFEITSQEVEKDIVGQVGVVRTSTVTKTFGEATVADGGAGLIVKVRPYKEQEFIKGDRVVLLEYVAESHFYRVISEKEFNQS